MNDLNSLNKLAADEEEPAVGGILDWPKRRAPGAMPGQLGMLAKQLNMGYSAMPVKGLMQHFNRTYSPMDVPDLRPPDLRTPGTSGIPQPDPNQPGPTAQTPDKLLPNGTTQEQWEAWQKWRAEQDAMR